MSKKHISVPQPDSRERTYYKEAQQLLHEGRTGLEAGEFSQNLLAPYLYDLAGLDVDYEDRSPALQKFAEARDKSLETLAALRTAKGKKAKRAAIENLKETQETDAFKDLFNKKGHVKSDFKGKKLKAYLKKQIKGSEKDIGDISAAPLRIKGFHEKADAAAQRQREAAILQQEQEMLQKSLSMNDEDVLAADPALKRSLEEERAKLDQAQVQQFGGLSGASGGTVGAVQNAAMMQRRAEAISNARRENIGLYAGLQTQQAGLNTQLASAKQGMAALPSSLQQNSAMNFGNLAGGYSNLINAKAAQRQMQFQANSFNQTQPATWETVLKGVSSLLQPLKQNG